MKKVIQMDAFKDVLHKAQAGLSKKETIEQGRSFIFLNGNVSSFNDEVTVTVPFPDIGEEIKCAVRCEELLEFTSKCKEKEVTLEWDSDNSEIVFSGKKFKAGFATSEIKIPLESISMPDKKDKRWVKIPGEFKTGLRACLNTLSTDMSQPVFACVHVLSSRLESCDRYRGTIYKMKTPVEGEIDFLIFGHIAKELVKYSSVDRMLNSEQWFHFSCENVMFSFRHFKDNFPDLKPIFTHTDESFVSDIEIPSGLIQIAQKAATFSNCENDSDVIVHVSYGTDFITVSAEKDVGWYKEKMKFHSEREFEFDINPAFLEDIQRENSKIRMYQKKIIIKAGNTLHAIAL